MKLLDTYSMVAMTSLLCLFSFSAVVSAQSDSLGSGSNSKPVVSEPVVSELVQAALPGKIKHLKFGVETSFVSDASRAVGLYIPTIRKRTPEAITKAAKLFLDLLPEKELAKISFEMNSQERSKWTNLPARPDAGGLRMGDLEQIHLKNFLELLAHLMSDSGYEKMRMIMLADDQLLKGNRRRPGFGIENFSVAVFGKPSETEPWALQLDGHHLGLNFAIAGDQITIAPSFIGVQPSRFKLGGHEIQPLQTEVDAAFALANQLDQDQFKQALVGERRGQLRLGPGRDGEKLETQGIPCSRFNAEQKQQLLKLVAAWVGNLPTAQAKKRMNEIEAEMDEMYFSWSGSRAENGDASYTIQGPSLVVEFAYQNLGGVPQNHVHTQYRNPKNDYGTAAEK